MAAWTVCILLIAVVLTGQGSKAQDCGQASSLTRIVGGTDATEGEWPWQVSMHYKATPTSTSYHICGGTLISEKWVLTAAHCMIATADKYILYFGILTQSGTNDHKEERTVKRIIIHNRWDEQRLNRDIALMELESPLTFNDYIKPVCLASSSSDFHTSTPCFATGWGRLGKDEPNVAYDFLQEVQIPVVGKKQCSCNYQNVQNAQITKKMICAGEENKGACQGDSGGPLQCNQNSRWIQAGITSFGVPCALAGYPEVYARVSQFEKWIRRKTRGSIVHFVTFTSSGTDPDDSFVCQNGASLDPTVTRINVTFNVLDRNATATTAPNTTVTTAINTTVTIAVNTVTATQLAASAASTITAHLTFAVIFVTVFLQHVVAP